MEGKWLAKKLNMLHRNVKILAKYFTLQTIKLLL